MKKIWQKSGIDIDSDLAKAVEKFTVGNDHQLDMRLITSDIAASRAHAWGLKKIGILTETEFNDLENAFKLLLEEFHKGAFTIAREDEDCHTAIEKFLTKKCKNAGKKIHTGRSRNDQVIVAIRLYQRDFIDQLTIQIKTLAENFLNFAENHEFIAMPGFTHTQRAMPASVGMWTGAFAEMFIWHLEQLQDIKKRINRSPLGSAAGFGVAFDLPREEIADRLGFESPVIIAMTVQNTRLTIDAEFVGILASIGQTLAQFSNDLIWFSSAEFQFFTVDAALTTGSSIMPQKKNLDPAEIIRGEVGYLVGYEQTLRSMQRNLISGYHRELGRGKEALFGACDKIESMVNMTDHLIRNIEPNREKLATKCTPEIFAADEANELVKNGMSFREAYIVVGEKLSSNVSSSEEITDLDKHLAYLDKNLRSKKHLGATGNLGLEILRKNLEKF